MRIKIPFIGKVKEVKTGGKFGVEIIGDPDDPVRIGINLGNVSWQLISLDPESLIAELEVRPAEKVSEDTGEIYADGPREGKPIFTTRKTTDTEKTAFLDNAKNIAKAEMIKRGLG